MWPTYSYAGNVEADSLYLIARNLIRASKPGEINWVLIVPDSRTTPVDDLDDRCDVQKVRRKMPTHHRVQEAIPDMEIVETYSPIEGDEPVDAVVSMSPARTMVLADAWSLGRTVTPPPRLVNWDLLVRDDGNGEIRAEEPELLHQAVGGVVADLNVHESPVARQMALSVARKHLSPANVRKMIETSVDVMQGIPAQRVLDLARSTPKREKFSVYYGGRFSTSKRVDDLAEVFDTFYRFGRDVEFVVTTGSLAGDKESRFRARFPEVELHVGKSQEEAWRIMASCHASICFSTHELFGMAFWEQIAAGLSVVMLSRKWNRDLLPPDYPWLAHAPQEAGALLRMIHEKWQAAGDEEKAVWGIDEPHAEWVRDRYDSQRNCREIVDWLLATHEKDAAQAQERLDGGAMREIRRLAEETLGEATGAITFAGLIAGMRSRSRVGNNVVGRHMKWRKSATTLDVLRIARSLGWEDTLVDGVMGLRRTDG